MIFEITHIDLKQALKEYLVKNEFIKPTIDFDFQVKTSRKGDRATRTIIETKYPRLGDISLLEIGIETYGRVNTPVLVQGKLDFESSTEPLEEDSKEVDISTSTEVEEEPVEAVEQSESTSKTPFKKLFG